MSSFYLGSSSSSSFQPSSSSPSSLISGWSTPTFSSSPSSSFSTTNRSSTPLFYTSIPSSTFSYSSASSSPATTSFSGWSTPTFSSSPSFSTTNPSFTPLFSTSSASSTFSSSASSAPATTSCFSVWSTPTFSSSPSFSTANPSSFSLISTLATTSSSIFGSTSKEIKEKENNSHVDECHSEMDENQDKILLHPKTLDGATDGDKEGGPNKVATDHSETDEPKSQVTSFIETPNAQTSNVTVSLDKDTREEQSQNTQSNMVLPTTNDILTSQTNLTTDDADMESFYAILDAETSPLSPCNDNIVVSDLTNITMSSEETQKALMTLQDFITKDFSVLLQPDEFSTMKTTLDYLTNLPAEDGISVQIRSQIIEVSRRFTCWSLDYAQEGKKIEYTAAKLLKAGELEEGLEANKTVFREVMSLENELGSELVFLEERKKELEEQINAVRANISAKQEAKNMAAHTKREVFEKAKILKAQRDELREQVPSLRDEQKMAKEIQANIRAEWSKLGENFNNSLKHEE